MSEDNTGLLKVTLLLYAVLCFIWGLGYVVIPDQLVEASGGEPVFSGWLRWSGAVLIALATGAVMVYRNPRHQGIFVTIFALGSFMCSLCLFWSMADVMRSGVGNWWFSASAATPTLILAVLFWVARSRAMDVLYPGD